MVSWTTEIQLDFETSTISDAKPKSWFSIVSRRRRKFSISLSFALPQVHSHARVQESRHVGVRGPRITLVRIPRDKTNPNPQRSQRESSASSVSSPPPSPPPPTLSDPI